MRTPHFDLAWRESPVGHPRTAIVVPRYQFTAVARNRLRRYDSRDGKDEEDYAFQH